MFLPRGSTKVHQVSGRLGGSNVTSPAGTWRIDRLIGDAPGEAWERMSCADGAKGPRVYDWAAARLPSIEDFDGRSPTHWRWVLARRSLARLEEIAYYLAYAPQDAGLAELVGVAGARWAIEECFVRHEAA